VAAYLQRFNADVRADIERESATLLRDLEEEEEEEGDEEMEEVGAG